MVDNSYKRDKKKFLRNLDGRITLFFLLCGLLFLVYILVFSKRQFIDQQTHFHKLLQISKVVDSVSSPRGLIFDRHQRLLVSNVQENSLVFYRVKDLKKAEIEALATRILDDLDLDTYLPIRNSDKREIYYQIAVNNGRIKTLIAQYEPQALSEYQKNHKISSSLKERLLSRISSEMLEEVDLRTYAWHFLIKIIRESGDRRIHVLVKDVDKRLLQTFLSHKEEYPGFDILFNWRRDYPQKELLKSVLGKVGEQEYGLPREEHSILLGKGYQLNDRIGLSGLEKQYETYLRGVKSYYQIKQDDFSDRPLIDFYQQGNKGYNLRLTIDSQLNQDFDQILINYFRQQRHNPYRPEFHRLQLVAMNPYNGEIYALSGIDYDRDKDTVINDPSTNYLSSLLVGSSVKGAVTYMGLNEGVINEHTVVMDRPWYFAATPVKGSYYNHGEVNLRRALEVSSNVYMFNIILKMNNLEYRDHMSLQLSSDTMTKLRNYYQSFGLGVPSYLDVPFEEIGYKGFSFLPGHILDNAIGYFDSFTNLQLAVYASAIANGGMKVRPHLLKELLNYNNNQILFQQDPQVLGSIVGNPTYLTKVVEGFRACVTSGNCGEALKNSPYEVASKTGTADVPGHNVNNTQISFAPVKKPQVVITCTAFKASKTQKLQPNPCGDILAVAYDKYFTYYPLLNNK